MLNETHEDSAKVIRLCRKETGEVFDIVICSDLVFVPHQSLEGKRKKVLINHCKRERERERGKTSSLARSQILEVLNTGCKVIRSVKSARYLLQYQ